MQNKKKTILYASGIIGLILLVLLVKMVLTGAAVKDIPVITGSNSVSEQVRVQIAEAYGNAQRKPNARNLGRLGMVYHSSAHYKEAAQCYKLASQKDKDEWVWPYYNGYLEMEMGNSEAVVDHFTRVTEINPDIQLAWYYMGNAYKNMRKFEQAEKALAHISSAGKVSVNGYPSSRQDHFPLSTYARFELARIYLESGQTDQAEKTLNEIIRTDGLFGPTYKLLGNIHNMKGDPVKGKKLTDRANDLVDFPSPVDPMIDLLVLMSRSELYLLKKIDEAEQSFHSDWALRLVNHGLQYMPDNKYMLSKAIRVYLWKNMNENLVPITARHIQLFKDDYIEIKNTGYRIYQKGLYELAMPYWNRALELKPGEFSIQEYLAKCAWAVGDKKKGLSIVDDIIQNSQSNVDEYASAVDLLYRFGQKDKADTHLARLSSRAPRHPKVLRLTGEMAANKGQWDKAIVLYKSSFDGDPQDTRTIRELGDLFMQQKMWKDYINLYRQTLEYHPNNPEYLATLGETLINCSDQSLRNVEEGMEYSERAFTSYNCPPDVLVAAGSFLSYAHLVTGNKQKAMTTISQTINIARKQNVPSVQQAKLEAMLGAIQKMEG